MAFRIEAIFIAAALSLSAQTFQVTHQHLRHDGPGELKVTDDGISFTEAGKHHEHSRTWKYEQIQTLTLTATELRVLTYEDAKYTRQDREFIFNGELAKTVYPLWKDKLDQRFVAALPDAEVQTLVEFPAKLETKMFKGVEGTLRFGDDRIVFQSQHAGDSRTWRFTDIQNIASAGPFDFSVVTLERNNHEFRFQLQKPMEQARFNELWRKLFAK